MANIIPTKSDEPVQRKISIKGDSVHLYGHTVKVNKEDVVQVQYEEIILKYPGGENAPRYILEKSAKTDWISVQAFLRKLTEKERMDFEGREVDCSDLDASLGKEKRKADPVARATNLLAKLTPEQKAELLAQLQG